MFDLPVETNEEKRYYSSFKKDIMKLGFIMLQYSIYLKSVNVKTKVEREIEKIKRICPPIGNIRVLSVTEHQYQNMQIISGEKTFDEQVNSELFLIKL